MPTFDAGGASAQATSTTRSVALTVAANTNRVLYAFTKDVDQVGMTSVVWNTTETMAQIASGTYNGAADNWFLYRLVNPTPATDSVLATFAGSGVVALTVVSVYDAAQDVPEDAADEAEGSGTAASNAVVGAVGDLLLAFIAATGTTTMAPTDTEAEVVDTGSLGSIRAYTLAGAASETFDVTLGTSRAWVLVSINLNAAAVKDLIQPGYIPVPR